MKINKLSGVTEISKHSVRIENYHSILHYMCKDVERSLLLTSDMRDSLTKLFAPKDILHKGSEYKHHVWFLEYKGQRFDVLTAESRGTDILIYDEDFNFDKKSRKSKTKIIIEFLTELENLLNNLEN